MKSKFPKYAKYITALTLFFLILSCTACEGKFAVSQKSDIEVSTEQNAEKTFSLEEVIPLNLTRQDFSDIPLNTLKDEQVGRIVKVTKVDDNVSCGEYIPQVFSEENPEGYTYSYVEISRIKYALSRSLGTTYYDLKIDAFDKVNAVYSTNELRGASYGVTLFIVIKDNTPYMIAEIDGFSQIADIDADGTKEVVSTVGTVPDASIYFFDFDNSTLRYANINEQSGAKYSIYDEKTNIFSLAVEPDDKPLSYVYAANELLLKH